MKIARVFFSLSLVLCFFSIVQAQPAQTWQTGQTTIYWWGDDGDLQRGVSWPSPRFEDNIDGTVTDHLTGLIWLKNANCFVAENWSAALADCNNLASGSCGLSDGSVEGDWRLSNRKELISLVDYSQHSPALPQGHLFDNVQTLYYWSSTTYAGSIPHYTRIVSMGGGSVSWADKSDNHYVWPVRGGQGAVQGAAPIWVPLYRLYNNDIHDHYYTTIPAERDIAVTDSEYTYEKIEGFISDRAFNDPNCLALYHLYNPNLNTHFYTADETEKAQKIAEGYLDKGPVGYIYSAWFEGGISLYRLYNPANTDYFCTVSEFERDYAINNWGFGEETLLGYVSPDGLMNPKSRLKFNAIVGDGVNTGNGNLNLYERTDFSIPGINIPLIFTRTYKSLNRGVDGPLGHGWTHSFDAVLKDDGTYVSVRWPDGHGDYYERDDNMTPDNPARAINQGCYDTIYQEWDGSYWITKKDQTQYVFKRPEGADLNSPAQFRTIIEKNGKSISLWYEDGNLVWIQDTSLRRLNFTYYTAEEGHSGHIKEITDPLGRIIRFEYDENDNLTGFIDARGNRTTYEYDVDHQLTKGTFPEENELNNTYENFKLVSQKKGAISNPLSIVYETDRTVITNPTGGVSHHNLADDQLISIEDPLGNIASFTFGDLENPTKPTLIEDKNGNTTTYTYKDGADDLGKKVLQRGNVLTVENALNQETAFEYDDKNNLTKKTDPLNHITNYEYDVNQRNLIKITYPEGGVQNISYTSNGQVETITDPNGHTTTYTYDSHGNITRVTDHLGNHTDFTCDNVGRLLTRMDQLERTTTYAYNENDNLLRVIDADNKATDYTYDTNNNLTTIADAREKETIYTYNDMDLLATETDPVGKVYQYGYDDKGNLTLIRDPDNNETTYVYDDNDRLTEIRYNTIIKVSFTEYDDNGNLLSMTDDNGETAFVYDALNRITSCNDSFGKTVSYGYDAAGNRTQITYPGTGKVVNYEYDTDNWLIKVTDWLNGETTYSYDNAGVLQSSVNPNGTNTIYSYDAANRLTGLSNRKSDDTPIAVYTYTLDAFGNHTHVEKNEPLMPTFTTADISYSYDDANKITSAGGTTYTHDGRGNLTGTSSGNVYSYDYADRLTDVTIGGEPIQYLYDGFGNRITRTAGGVQTRYVLDLNGPMSQVLAETDSGGNVINYYIYGLGLISKITASNQRSCYHYDSRGSTIAIAGSGENITEKYAYDEFGEILASEETNANPFRYVGKYGVMDEGNGLLFMRARYYDVATGRFLSKDPLRGELVEPGSLNRYVYVSGNPISKVDPTGLFGSLLGEYLGVVMEGTINFKSPKFWFFSLFGAGVAGLSWPVGLSVTVAGYLSDSISESPEASLEYADDFREHISAEIIKYQYEQQIKGDYLRVISIQLWDMERREFIRKELEQINNR